MKFKSDIEVQAGLKDSSGSNGSSGQVLSSNGGTVSWVNAGGGTASDVQNQVKAGVAINKGQAVYVTSADGTNIIVGLASNTTEATSSKTLGLLNATVAINGFADVVQIGKLEGLDTSTATVGDPVWLGTNGNLIYGLANKPYAPAHLVYIGVVTRVNANNGEIFVTVQNGFELKEIHDVDIITTPPSGGDVLGFEGAPVNLWVNKTIPGWLGYTPVPTTRTLTINGSTQDLSANRTFTIDTGVTSFNTRTGAVTLTSGDVTTALGYIPVTQARTLTINGVSYDLSANRSWTVTTPETDTLQTVTNRGNATTTSIYGGSSSTISTGYTGVYGTPMVGAYNGSKLIYLYNDGTTLKLDAYNYGTPSGLNIQIGGNGGYAFTDTSFRAPIFYDSNNTGYYLDPASTSNLNIITTTGYVSIGGSAYLASGNSLYFDSGVTNDYSIKKNGTAMQFDSGGDFTFNKGVNILTTRDNALVLRAMDGGTNPWNYIEYVNSAGTRKYYVGTDTSNVFNIYSDDGTGYVGSNTSFRAPIFYDSNDTTYYGDFASTSNFSKLLLNSQNSFNTTTPGLTSYGLTLMGGTADYANGVTWTWGNTNAQAGVYVQSSGAYGTKMYFATTDSFATGSKTGMSMDHNGTVLVTRSYMQSDSSLRAPVFYDSNDTTYYSDLASTSQTATRQRGGTVYGPNTTWGAYLLVGGNGRTGYIDNTLTPSVCATDGNIHLDAASGKTMYLNWYDGSSIIFGSGVESQIGFMSSSGDFTANSSSRSPIFYDSNDTAYYINPADADVSAVLKGTVTIGGGTGGNYDEGLRIIDSGGFSVIAFGASGNSGPGRFNILKNSSDAFEVRNASGGQIWWTNQSGNTVFNTDVRSPIFYDYNNTGYYLDPASTSNLNSVTINSASTVYGGLSIVRSGGASDPYGALSVSAPSSDNYAYMGFTRNGIIGMAMGIDTNNNYWIGTSGGGFSSVRTGTYMTVSSGGNVIATADFRAPIFYDSNDTGYYVDPASTSNIRNITVSSLANSTGLTVNHSGSTPAPAAKFNSAGGGTTYGAITATFDSCNYGTAIRVVTGLWSASQGAIQFYSNTTPVGNIQCSTTTTTYSTTSDYRLKENVVAMESSIDRLKALNPCRFNFKNEPTRIVDGFIAHEVQAIIPEAVTGKKDEIDPTGEPVYQGIDQAKIVPLLTAALQEAIEKINNLEQRINILENK